MKLIKETKVTRETVSKIRNLLKITKLLRSLKSRVWNSEINPRKSCNFSECQKFPCFHDSFAVVFQRNPPLPLFLIDHRRPNSFPFLDFSSYFRSKKRRLRGMKGRFQEWRCEKAGHEGRSGPRLVRCLFSTQAFFVCRKWYIQRHSAPPFFFAYGQIKQSKNHLCYVPWIY